MGRQARITESVMADLHIAREDTPDGGRYVATVPGVAAEADLTFARPPPSPPAPVPARPPPPGIVSASHTGVPDEMRGQGVGTVLVKALAADARRDGFRIVPRGVFVAGLAQRIPNGRGCSSAAEGPPVGPGGPVVRARCGSRRQSRGFSRASIPARCGSRKGGRDSASPIVSNGSSVAKPGPSVAISNRLPPGSRK